MKNCNPTTRLVWVRFGSYGIQIMLIANETAEAVFGFKWRDKSREWTNRVKISKSAIKGPVTEADKTTLRVKRAMAAMVSQLSIVNDNPVK